MAIQLDLRRDLPKVREQWRAVTEALGQCDYTAPCVVGAMVPESTRAVFQGATRFSPTIERLIDKGLVAVPDDQRRDFVRLQAAFDDGDLTHFERTLADVEQKYLAEQGVEALIPKPSVWISPDTYLSDRVRIRADA